jgi:broad specificity phosphatase PhoE
VETAELATAGTELKTQTTEALRERTFLQLIGKEVSAILAELGTDGELLMTGNSDVVELAQDESYADARERVLAFFDGLPARYGGKRVLVVAHGGPHQWLVERALGTDLKGTRGYRWGTGCFSRFTLSSLETRIEALNLAPSAVVPGLELGAV